MYTDLTRKETMTTNKQLREWLSRFDDDAEISVVVGSRGYGYSGDTYYTTSLELPDVLPENISWSNSDFDTVEFTDIQYDYDQPCCTIVKEILLGKVE